MSNMSNHRIYKFDSNSIEFINSMVNIIEFINSIEVRVEFTNLMQKLSNL